MEFIQIQLTRESAAVLGALLVIANNELLQLDRDLSNTLEKLRTAEHLRFSTQLENELGDFVGALSKRTIKIECSEDGKVTVIEELHGKPR